MAFSTTEIQIVKDLVPQIKEQGFKYWACAKNVYSTQYPDQFGGYDLIFYFFKVPVSCEETYNQQYGIYYKFTFDNGIPSSDDIKCVLVSTSNSLNQNAVIPRIYYERVQLDSDHIDVPAWYPIQGNITYSSAYTLQNFPDCTYTEVHTYENTYYIVFFFTVFVMCWLFARVFRR